MPKEFALVSMNPFTPRQREIIALRLKGLRSKEIARALSMSTETLRIHIKGTGTREQNKQTYKPNKSTLGILGIIEQATGKRPEPATWFMWLFGDVILEVPSQQRQIVNLYVLRGTT